MQDKKSLEVLDHAAGVADDLIARVAEMMAEQRSKRQACADA